MPSSMNALMLGEVKIAIGKAASIILVDASRLKSNESLKLRKDLRSIGAKLKVAKVALLKRAVPENAAKMCEGTRSSIGVVVCDDMVAAAKIVAELAKEEKLAVRGGADGRPGDRFGHRPAHRRAAQQAAAARHARQHPRRAAHRLRARARRDREEAGAAAGEPAAAPAA